MNLFKKYRESGKENEKGSISMLQQDLSQKEKPGSVFVIHMLMKEHCPKPKESDMKAILEKYLGEGDCIYGEEVVSFLPKQYQVEFQEGTMPPQLLIMDCIKNEEYRVDEIIRSQMWDCPESKEILETCHYHVVATDLLAGDMDYWKRSQMLMDYLEALLELYPTCVAVQFQSSGKMFTREKILQHEIPREHRFIYFAVNVRYFHVQGTEDMLVDTVGMSPLHLPDLQYHFHAMDANWVVNHAYNMLTYLFDHNDSIQDGDTIDGVINGEINSKIQWQCRYEDALIQPSRPVIDICMGEWASGTRDE